MVHLPCANTMLVVVSSEEQHRHRLSSLGHTVCVRDRGWSMRLGWGGEGGRDEASARTAGRQCFLKKYLYPGPTPRELYGLGTGIFLKLFR